ncbi:MAG: copper chaperone PCu(A)C [Gemmobacter sp.]
MLKHLLAAATAALLAVPAAAHDGIHIEDAYARASGMSAQSGAVFFRIENHSDQPDRLIEAASDVAERVELHTHMQDAQGVMRMVEVKDGFPVEGGGVHMLQRGGDHVMLLGLRRPLVQGETFPLTLTFERGEVITIDVMVDNDRMPEAGHGHGHGHGHGMQKPASN